MALPAAAQAANQLPRTDPLPRTALALTSTRTTTASCETRDASGATRQAWVARATGYSRMYLSAASGDWDIALFDARNGRRLDASQGFGASEVVQTWTRKGQSVVVQACRRPGAARSARLAITADQIAVPKAPSSKPGKASLVSIPLTSGLSFSALQSLGINTDESPDASGRSVAAVLEPGQAATLTGAGFTFRTLDSDLASSERRYRAKEQVQGAQAAGSALPSGRTTYRHYPDIQADLKKIVADHPAIARPVTLPVKSFQGRPIEGIEVSSDVAATDDGKPTFFLMGTHHAREWPSAEIPTEMGIYLTQNYGSDKRVTALLDKVRVVIVPVINPDGYIASREATDPADTSGDPGGAPSLVESVAPPGGSLAYRRKNCDGESPDPATPCELQHGVDPNRNYGFNWGGPGAGTDPNTQDYRGTGQWSEPETQAVHAFSQTRPVTTLITMHNFASLVLRPPGVHDQGMAPDEDELKKLGDLMAKDTGYTSQFSYELYDTSGTTEDWNYGAAGTFGYTIEMGPASDKGGNFHVSYDRAVVNQWTGSESEDGKGKGLRDALLAAGETAADRSLFSTIKGSAPPDSIIRVRKDFKTFSAEPCVLETLEVSCQGQGT
ncbi:MAG: hypothetical protein QOJ07_3361, partial [Thermoleophilaceae bacterium]|nr:hypothetical protein [Thermoleophilaceae bacterium]